MHFLKIPIFGPKNGAHYGILGWKSDFRVFSFKCLELSNSLRNGIKIQSWILLNSIEYWKWKQFKTENDTNSKTEMSKCDWYKWWRVEKNSNSDFIQRETLLTMYRNNNIDAKNAQNPNSHFTAKSDRIYKSKLLCLVYLHRPIDYKNCLLSNKTEIASNTFILMHSYILCK